MTRAAGSGFAAALCGGLLLGLATPPAPAPFAEWLVLPALAIWYAVATASARPWLSAYVYGCVHMAWFSWSVRHVLFGGYAAIVLVGGLYYVLAAAVVRPLPRRLAPVGFAIAVAASFWLRAVLPEIHYPHGQPCHCLWQWPTLLGSVALGGEPLANGLLVWVAAAAVEVLRSWRLAVPAWAAARRGVAVAAGVAVLATAAGGFGLAAAQPVDGASVRVVAIEPGMHPGDELRAGGRDEFVRYRQLQQRRLFDRTRNELRGEPSPDLVLWPESSLFDEVPAEEIAAGRAKLKLEDFAARATRIVVGAAVRWATGGTTPTALLVELPSGRVLAHQDKRMLVPGGEFLPLGFLPSGLAAWLRERFQRALGTPPDCVPGTELPPLTTAAGVPFAALLCYDNAFPGPAAAQVAAGARFVVVLSNEAWYRGGGELWQMVAMTVVRALETATPFVRCTQDGLTVAIDGGGRVLAALDHRPAPQPAERILPVSVPLGLGREPPMAWLRRASGPATAALLALAAAHAIWQWVRLRAARTASRSVPDSAPGGGHERGS